MAQYVPKKNIDPVMVDVKNPSMNYSWSVQHSTVNLSKAPMASSNGFAHALTAIKYFFGISLLTVLIFSGINMYRIYEARDIVKNTGVKIGENFSNSVTALQNLDSERASAVLRANNTEIKKLDSILQKGGVMGILETLGKIIPTFSEGSSLMSHVASLNMDFLQLTDTTSVLKKNGFRLFQSNGTEFLASIKNVQVAIQNIISETQAIKNATTNLKQVSSYFNTIDAAISEKYVTHSTDLYRSEAFLGKLLSILQDGREQHILLLFQNPAEIRPGGGFIGSYADVTLQNGQMNNIDVRDIYDPDGQFFEKIVPPYQLQTVSENWGARDANWFFDFPTSAKTVVKFLETSRMYSEKNVTFDAVIAINIPVLQSLLDAVGPIPLPEYNLTIDSSNFLTEVQREVEAGNDKKAGYPKRILKVLTPLLLEKLKGLNTDAQHELVLSIGDHISKKDIMFYAKDSELASYINEAKAGGAIFEIPQRFFGSYLAVVDANVAGGKTDAFIQQSINATVNVDTGGATLTDLEITREHKGGNERDPWWNAENKNFIQIYTNLDSTLVSLKGNTIKKIVPTFNYAVNEYSENEDLKAIDGSRVSIPELNAWTMHAFGKSVFATWFNTPGGKKRTLTMRYHTDNTSGSLPADGVVYTFVYERQSGVQSNVSVRIVAPIGFVWAESDTPSYAYTNNDPEGRVMVSLTLKKQ